MEESKQLFPKNLFIFFRIYIVLISSANITNYISMAQLISGQDLPAKTIIEGLDYTYKSV